MTQREINRVAEMEVFVTVVEQNGLSAAARERRMTPSAVSKLVSRLEARLGTQLLARSTRRLRLTPEGDLFYQHARRILADIDEAERTVASGEEATGRVRLNTSASFNTHILAPVLPDFLARHPRVGVDLALTDHVVDLMEARADIAVRAGPLKSSNLIARKLGTSRNRIVAAPAYIERHGQPETPADLGRHTRLGFCYERAVSAWPFRVDGVERRYPPDGRILASDGESLRALALGGAGLARLAEFTVRADIAAGRLVPVLQDHICETDVEDFYAVYVGAGELLPTRVRVFLDFLAEHARVT
ncbi:MAG: LysR family transcriptional regulator [Oceanicaulis sp.]|nr:LysR family transcriptional regulator [Oceanicaulis sp.]MAZ92033.1 LysR family transcriptional regulator [Maricaulis sp.]MBI75173.1 LysR family transcriptional regulator [Oceanicaulis sp.]|tara:strand:- start:1495 stop:2403 length:909 start_codon:yes stop_codon:yes gene_type:complete